MFSLNECTHSLCISLNRKRTLFLIVRQLRVDLLDLLEKMREDLQRWIWKHCPFCNSEARPNIEGGGGGGYQEHIILKCPDCGNSLKFVTEWSPIIDFPPVNEIPEMIQDEYCPYLSIQKKEDRILLRCCSNIWRDCFGRPPEICYSYHRTRMDEAFETRDYDTATLEAEATIKLWKKEHPEEVPPLGTSQLVEIKRRTLNRTGWIKWIDDQLKELEACEDFGSAASIAFMVAEVLEEPRFWKRASQLYDRYVEKLRIELASEGWFEKRQRNRKMVRAEIMSFEALSEIEDDKKSELLKLAGDKWLKLYRLSADPFSHPDFLYYAFYLRNRALAEPKEAPDLYKEAYEFLMSQLDKVKYPRKRLYYKGHGKYFLGLHYLTKTNYTQNEDEKVSLLEKAIDTLNKSIELHRIIGFNEVRTNIILNCIKSVLCVERFKKDEKYELIHEATKYLDAAKTYELPHKIIETIDALIGSYKEAFLAIENPEKALLLMARSTGKLDEFVRLLPSLSIRDVPIPKMLEANKDYLSLYLDTINRNVTSFAGRRLSFNNIRTVLDRFRVLTERQLYGAFEITENPSEEIARSLVQTYLGGSFPQRKFQFREVEVAKGKSDNLLIISNEKYPFEAKIWKGPQYYQKGLKQIKYYMGHEDVAYGFYIIFDPRVRDHRSGGEIIEYDSKTIYQTYIHISPGRP